MTNNRPSGSDVTAKPAGTNETAQERFDRLYVGSAELCERLGVYSTSILAQVKNGKFPPPIRAQKGRYLIWERDAIEPHLQAWENALKFRRGDYDT